MRLGRRAADGVDDCIDFEARRERVECWKHEADFGPQRAEHELAPAGRLHSAHEVLVFPGVNRGAVNRLDIRKKVRDLPDHRLVDAGLDVDRRQHDRQAIQLGRARNRRDVFDQGAAVARRD